MTKTRVRTFAGKIRNAIYQEKEPGANMRPAILFKPKDNINRINLTIEEAFW